MRRTDAPAGKASATDLTGFVLVGGRSSRMGRDKALLPFGSVPMAAHVAGVVKQVVTSVFLVGPPAVYGCLGFDVLPDRYPDFGPVGAIAAALAATTSEWNLIVGCDLPRITTAVLRQVHEAALDSGASCAYAAAPDGHEQPLCGVYHVSTLNAFESAVARGEHRLMQVASQLHPYVLHLKDAGPLWNVNTPEDWKAVTPAAR